MKGVGEWHGLINFWKYQNRTPYAILQINLTSYASLDKKCIIIL